MTKKLEVSQELNVSPTAVPVSVNDFVAFVMTCNTRLPCLPCAAAQGLHLFQSSQVA